MSAWWQAFIAGAVGGVTSITLFALYEWLMRRRSIRRRAAAASLRAFRSGDKL